MQLLKKIAKYAVIMVGAISVLVLGLNFWIISSTSGQIYYNITQVPSKKVALLLGTSKRTVKGGTNKYFKERIDATAELYHRGVIDHVIVSGDNNTVYYNEPKDMLNALMALGVSQADITLDFAGFRTLDSVVRSKLIFGQDELIIITQDFHCYRALFIADYYGMDAVAFSADNKDQLPLSLAIREILARTNTVLDLYVFNRGPKFLGEKEKLPID
ncbi:SanA/YdcF family protein [Marinoscillum luteum]|uniref:Vancomycin high temperature exclusion protein n=1 Tax=Marinoscillum luteum TaxID=861051 RepID=A0ABW7N4I0_9BACT